MAAHKRPDVLLLERYQHRHGKHPGLRRGLGLPWALVRSELERDAVDPAADGLTLSEAAAVLDVSPRRLAELEQHCVGTPRLFPRLAAKSGGIKRGRVPVDTLLDWAESLPQVRGWRQARPENLFLGATARTPDILRHAEALQRGSASVVVAAEGSEEPTVLRLHAHPDIFPMDSADLHRQQDALPRGTSRGGAAQTRVATLPEAFSWRWHDPALQRAWRERYRQTLASLELLLEQRRHEARAAIERAQAQMALTEQGRGMVRAAMHRAGV